MRILIRRDAEAVACTAADLLAREVAAHPEPVLGLPTGRTAIPLYDELARRHEAGTLDLSRARGLNLDELVLPRKHPESFHSFMERHGWDRIGLPRERCDIPDGDADELGAECRRYDRVIAEAGGLDVAILGIGSDGHVAYNVPGPPRQDTHVVRVPDRVADRHHIEPRHRPLRSITMGMRPLAGAERILLLALTADKARAVEALVEGPEDPEWPASLLRSHPAFDVILTLEAAGRLDSLPDGATDTVVEGAGS